MSELKPCPCCGGEGKRVEDVFLLPTSKIAYCGVCGLSTKSCATWEETESAWNLRPQPNHIVDTNKMIAQPDEPLTLHLGDGKHFIADYSYLDSDIVGICAYPRESDDGVIGAEDIGSRGKTTEAVGAVLKIEFSKREAIDVVIRALERAKGYRPDAPLTLEELRGMDGEPVYLKASTGVYACIVQIRRHRDDCGDITLVHDKTFTFTPSDGTAYRRKPEGGEG